MMRIPFLAALLLFTGLMFLYRQPDVEGCASAPRPGYTISIAEESAVIVWDPVKKVEHFIRSAAFDTKSPDFGFLVPTPTQPTLTEVTPFLFKEIGRWLEPNTVEQARYKFSPILCCPGGGSAPMAKPAPLSPPVRVLAEQKVGGFDATVLEADDTDSLSKWITGHGYSSDPELQSWLAPYVFAKWKITAFKIIQDPKTGELATTKPVRMSFATDRPFFPYREPEKKEVPASKKKKPIATELDGIWTVESAQGHEKLIRNLRGTPFWFGNGVAVGHFMKDIPFTVDASKEPKWLDLSHMKGIYKLEGDTLTWCQGSAGARPNSFEAKDDVLLVLRRGTKADVDIAAAGVAARELEQRPTNKRLLRVLFISDSRADAKFGNNTAWHANIPWSDQLTDDQRKDLARDAGLAEADLPANAWMTTFEDRASPRPGNDEIYFDPAQDRTRIRPPDRIRYNDVWIPADLVLLSILFAGLFGALVLRRRYWQRS